MMNTMLGVLMYVNRTGSNPNYKGPNTRGAFNKLFKEDFGKDAHKILMVAWNSQYIRPGRLWGFVLTKKGLNEYWRLEYGEDISWMY